MKLLTLEEAQSYKLNENNHICNKLITLDNTKQIKKYNFIILGWQTEIFNHNDKRLMILFEDDYWQPYCERLIIEQYTKNYNLKFSYKNGTKHYLGIFASSGMFTCDNFEGYEMEVTFN